MTVSLHSPLILSPRFLLLRHFLSSPLLYSQFFEAPSARAEFFYQHYSRSNEAHSSTQPVFNLRPRRNLHFTTPIYIRPTLQQPFPLGQKPTTSDNMCYRLVERYSVCRCLYHKHNIDPCAAANQQGHRVQERTILVGYLCDLHSSRRNEQPADRSRTDYADSGYGGSRDSHRYSSSRHRR
jgi:hypothetical protein